MELREKLLELREAIPYIQKDTKGQNCTYAKGVDLLGVIKPKMANLKINLIPQVLTQNLQMLESGLDKNGVTKYTYVVNGDMAYVWQDVETGERESVNWQYFGKHNADPAQAFGCAMTYAERYFLLKFFQIETDKDDPDAYNQKQEQRKPISEEEIAQLREVATKAKRSETNVCKFLGISSYIDLSRTTYNRAITILNGMIKKDEIENANS
jgi:hypothetical protein